MTDHNMAISDTFRLPSYLVDSIRHVRYSKHQPSSDTKPRFYLDSVSFPTWMRNGGIRVSPIAVTSLLPKGG